MDGRGCAKHSASCRSELALSRMYAAPDWILLVPFEKRVGRFTRSSAEGGYCGGMRRPWPKRRSMGAASEPCNNSVGAIDPHSTTLTKKMKPPKVGGAPTQ